MNKELEDKIDSILNDVSNGELMQSHAKKQLLEVFYDTPTTYGIVRWTNNDNDDVVCVNKEIAKSWADSYNKLSGSNDCYIDENVWIPFSEMSDE